MKTDKFKYHVIWIDDKYKEYDGFITNAAMDGVGVTPFEYGKDGLRALVENIDYWDGVVLDVKCCFEEGDLDRAENFYKVREELQTIKFTKRPSLPYYVYSAQPDILSNSMFIASLNGKKLYEKAIDDDDLIKDIVTEAEKLPETKLRLKYLSDIPFPELYTELYEILAFIEEDKTDIPDPLEKTRLILNWVMNYCNAVGILPIKHNGSNLSECSVFLGKKNMQKYVPLHIQRSLHSAVDISNNASHRVEVFNAIRSRKAPFLIRSTVFDLLNILVWCGKLPISDEEREKIRAEVSLPSDYSEYEGELLKDENGNWHCGDYLITYKDVGTYDLKENDIIHICKAEPNNKKSFTNPYTYRAQSMIKI